MNTLAWLRGAVGACRGTIIHPQWLSDRFHLLSRTTLGEISNAVVVDVGCGRSDNCRWLGQHNILYRLDYPATNGRYENAPDIYGDACRLPVKTATIDAILMLEVLEHVADAEAALDEIRRVLRPGGKIYLSVPFIYPLHDQPFDYRRFTIYGLRQMLKNRGLHIEREIQHGNSLIVALQVFNLALVEVVRNLSRNHGVGALAFAILIYPMMLVANILALPFLQNQSLEAACFGYFIVARNE